MLSLYTWIQSVVGRIRHQQQGATATEYALLVALIALVIVAGVGLFGKALDTFFEGIADEIPL